MSTNRIWGCFYAFLFFVTCMTCAYINGQTSMRAKMREHEQALAHELDQTAMLFDAAQREIGQYNKPHALPKKPSRWDAVDLNN